MPDITIQVTLFLSVFATAAMSASAAIQAVRHEFDAFGAAVLAAATAMGGGTVRDLLLGRTPVFWMTDLTYLATAVPVSLAVFFWARGLNPGNGRRHRMLMYFDAVGLALFTLTGLQIGLAAGMSAPIAIILGCITGTFGGMIRDVLCNVTPSVLKEDLYATISLLGGALFLALDFAALGELVAVCASFGVMFVMRVIVVARSIR
ncbi:TRIC cation channel family protein [Yoonia sp. SS1-5]|uniref:Trimeric intracellular cation channel family protein n=1 Tax=Yoonia rhodophyticola TaxID=3137370 RepID=A0AAN0MFF1_9RHOB